MGMLLPCSCILIWFQDSLRDLLKAYNARSCIPLGFYLMHATLIVCLGRVFMQHHTTASLIICNAFQNAAFATTSASVPSRKSWLPAGFGGSGKHGATIDIPLEVYCWIVRCSCNPGVASRIAWWFRLESWHVVACRIQRRRRESCCHGSRIWSGGNRSEWLFIDPCQNHSIVTWNFSPRCSFQLP